MSRSSRSTRADYRFFHTITTRWKDNDVYGHVNNVEFYSYFDTAVNFYLVSRNLLDIAASTIVGVSSKTAAASTPRSPSRTC
jgi:acyl-CoA thioester hydrolase